MNGITILFGNFSLFISFRFSGSGQGISFETFSRIFASLLVLLFIIFLSD
jgi:hypothetical protein